MALQGPMQGYLSTLRLDDERSERKLGRWLELLGIPDAHVRRTGVRTALRFFAGAMPRLPVSSALNFLSAMDLSKPVSVWWLKPDFEVIAFRFPDECRFKLFYTLPGESMSRLGVLPDGRKAVRYDVHTDCAALHSYTTGAIDHWSEEEFQQPASREWQSRSVTAKSLGRVVKDKRGHDKRGFMVPGGAQQLIIPNAWGSLNPL